MPGLRSRFAPFVSFALVAATLSVTSPAAAYRPFDGTDADVAAHGEFELELGPVGYLYDVNGSAMVLPALVLNFGIVEDWELVFDARHQLELASHARLHGVDRSRILETDVLLKHILRKGSLQDEEDEHHSGISVATELGPLLPELGGSHGVGFGVNLIASQRWENVTLHLNSMPQIDREHRADWFESLIMEGPFRWRARPVAEASVEKEWYGPTTGSILVGTIVRVTDDFYLDAAGRTFRISGEDQEDYEVRLGFTWGVPMFEPGKEVTKPEQTEPEGEKKAPSP